MEKPDDWLKISRTKVLFNMFKVFLGNIEKPNGNSAHSKLLVNGIFLMMIESDLVLYAYDLGKRTLERRKVETLKEYGQFLTPPAVARYMAKQLGQLRSGAALLEPAVGSAVLVCAVIERLIAENRPLEISIEAYEIDTELCEVASQVLTYASQKAEQKYSSPAHKLNGLPITIIGCIT
jgi:type I restriction-modification system DNA methylase subunit